MSRGQTRVRGVRILLYPNGLNPRSAASLVELFRPSQGLAHSRRTNEPAGVGASGSGCPASPPHVGQAVARAPLPAFGRTRSVPTGRTLGHAPSHSQVDICGPPPLPLHKPLVAPFTAAWPAGATLTPQELRHPTPPGRPSLELGAGVMTDGRRAGLRGEGAEPPSMGALAADRKTRGSGREGLADTAGSAGAQAWREGARADTGG